MAKWKVWNRHPNGLTHKEKFKEQSVEIKAGEYVLMDYEDAVQFRGQYFPMKKDAQGAPDPAGFKVIHLEKHEDSPEPAVVEFVCHFDGAKFPTKALLDNYLTKNYADQTFNDDALDAEIQKEAAVKRGPGRPPKEKTL